MKIMIMKNYLSDNIINKNILGRKTNGKRKEHGRGNQAGSFSG